MKPVPKKPIAAAPQKSLYEDYLKMGPTQEMPYMNLRATPEDLQSFPISQEDWAGGGGRLMFQDPKMQKVQTPINATVPAAPKQMVAPKKAPAVNLPAGKKTVGLDMLPGTGDMGALAENMPEGPAVAPKIAAMLLEKRAEEEMLAFFRREMLKVAGVVYTAEEINRFTESVDSLVKAAEAEAHTVWTGIEDELRKQGANTDFIDGMLKEASVLGDTPQVQIPAGPAPAGAVPMLDAGKMFPQIQSDPRLKMLQPFVPKLNEAAHKHALGLHQQGKPIDFSNFDFDNLGRQTVGKVPIVGGTALESWNKGIGEHKASIVDSFNKAYSRYNPQASPTPAGAPAADTAQMQVPAQPGVPLGGESQGPSQPGATVDTTSAAPPPAPAAAPATPSTQNTADPNLADDPNIAANSGAIPEHQIIPGIGNKWIGGIGGGLLAGLLGNSMGLKGPMSWLLPVLGGVAGYKYIPQLMNSWKGTPGDKGNPTNPAADRFNYAQKLDAANREAQEGPYRTDVDVEDQPPVAPKPIPFNRSGGNPYKR